MPLFEGNWNVFVQDFFWLPQTRGLSFKIRKLLIRWALIWKERALDPIKQTVLTEIHHTEQYSLQLFGGGGS